MKQKLRKNRGYSIWEALLGLLLFSLCAGLAAGGLSLVGTGWKTARKEAKAQLLFHTAAAVITGELLMAEEVWEEETLSFFSLKRGARISLENRNETIAAVYRAAGEEEVLFPVETLPEGLQLRLEELRYQQGRFRFLLQVGDEDRLYEEQELWVTPWNYRKEQEEHE